nr:unnamed protein product [Callosobruchus chinensis]
MARWIGPVLAALLFCFVGQKGVVAEYLGKLIGKLSELHHGVSGEVYAVDGRTLHIKDFTYDGQGPAAYFYASTNKAADKRGFRLRDENGSPEVIRRYRKEPVTLTLPEGKTLRDIKIFYLWCEDFDVNFGDVKIPKNFAYPRPQKIEPLKGIHGISSDNIVIVDAQTLLVPNLSYDGEAPDAKFWVGQGAKPSPQGIRVPDENGKEAPLRKYDRKTVVLTLPGDLTIFDIGHFGIWCEQFTVDFGHVQIPQGLNIPPSLKMLGISPQSKLNCEVLYDDLAFEVRWAVAGESIVLQLVAKLGDREYMSFGISGDNQKSVMVGGDVVVAWVDKDTLKGFAEDYYLDDKSQCSGPTGSCPDNRLNQQAVNNIRLLNAAAVNGYSIVTYQRPLVASDRFDRDVLTNGSQAIIWAVGPLNQRNEVSFHTKYLKGDKLLEFGRPARWNCPAPESADPTKKVATSAEEQTPLSTITATQEPVHVSTEEAIVATSPASRRTTVRRRGGGRPQAAEIDFGATKAPEAPQPTTPQLPRRRGPQRGSSTRDSVTAVKEVPTPTPVKTKRDAWEIPDIQCYEPEDGVFYAQMGPTGGKRGYPAITGHVGWGISWYINGLLIPVIHVVRGKTYTFVVEGGLDPEVSAKYHPFYITDDPVGGYAYKTPEERKAVKVFAGVRKAKDGTLIPTGTGRLCHWTQSGDLEADDYPSFGAYQRSLELKCDPGEPGVIQWTPDENTPDTVYYQCFTHRYLGWKIIVHDTCDGQAAASALQEVAVAPPADFQDKSDVDLEDSPSIQVETMVKANDISKEDHPAKSHAQSAVVSERPVIRPDPLPTEHVSTHGTQADPFFRWNRPLWQQTPKYFRPSTLLNETPESTNFHFDKIATTSSTTTTTTTTSTTTTTTTTPKPVDNVAMPSSALNETFLLPPPPKYMSRPPGYHKRPSMHYPVKLRQPSLNLAPRPNPNVPLKSKFSWSPPKLVFSNRPYQFEQPKYSSKPTFLPQKQVTTKAPAVEETKFRGQVHDVEISPQQPSTEREPEIQTAPSPSVLDITPVYVRPAFNTGFRPGSIKIESGFKPIISKDFQDRMDEDVDEPLVEPEGETGVIEVAGEEKFENKPIQVFEPMFVPSPTDKPIKPTKRKVVHKRPVVKEIPEYTKIVVKHTRSLPDPLEDQKAEAAERVESYYLPPANQRQKPMERISQPSNIDIEAPEELDIGSPPDIVVTYDGKRVSGQSLTAKVSDRTPIVDTKFSKASAFIRARPQFGKFRGELPPLNPEFINKNAPQLQSGSLSRDLDTPAVPSGSTRLSKVGSRSKRAAHHTPEHTSQQEEERKMNNTQKSSAWKVPSRLSISFAVLYILGYLCFA